MGDVSDMRHRLFHYLETKALNLGFGQSPMSRRLLMLLIVLHRISFSWILRIQLRYDMNHERYREIDDFRNHFELLFTSCDESVHSCQRHCSTCAAEVFILGRHIHFE